MYNGIGLLSVRGSGTSGYVQTNKFNLRRGPPMRSQPSDKKERRPDRQPNQEILEHNKKRALELKLAEYAESLEEQGWVDERSPSPAAWRGGPPLIPAAAPLQVH